MEQRYFWNQIDELVVQHTVVIDRPKGSRHPRYSEVIYPLDYGYLEGTTSSDGGGIDVWQGTDDRTQVTGIVCTLDWLKRDMEIKLLLGCSEAEMQVVERHFQTNEMACMLVRRGETKDRT